MEMNNKPKNCIVKIKYTNYSEQDLDEMISKGLGKVPVNSFTDKMKDTRTLEFVYPNKKDAKIARFINKKVPRTAKLDIEYGA